MIQKKREKKIKKKKKRSETEYGSILSGSAKETVRAKKD